MELSGALLDPLTEREREILTRLSNGLSDQEIAAELFLSSNTIRWYNRQIYSKLGVGSRTQAIAHAKILGLLDNAISPSVFPTFRHNLPAPTTPFVGRNREIEEVMRLLANARLLTLTGTGGTGKTRLALRVAEEIAESFSDGVCFVDLAPIGDPAQVVNAIATALGVVENTVEPLTKTVKRVLARQQLLLVVDNFEHVIPAAPLVTELLTEAPHLKVLATSRESLRLTGEQEYPVLPLTLPTGDTTSIERLIESESGALFVQRAQMIRPHLEVNAASAAAIAEICTRLDGLPLAIELAAVRCKLLSPQALLERLEADDSALRTLTSGSRDAPARQRTLRDSIEWSYNLLDDGEKRLFARLAVFRGGRSLEAIEAVCADGLTIDVFDGLESLVDKSLVQQKETPNGEPRFILLEMIHEFARERLDASGEAEAIRQRHAVYFAGYVHARQAELCGANEPEVWRDMKTELENLRAAWRWTLAQVANPGSNALCVDLLQQMVPMIADFYGQQSRYHEGLELVHETRIALEAAGWGETQSREIQRVLALVRTREGRLRVRLSQFAEAETLLQQSLPIFEALGEMTELAATCYWQATLSLLTGKYEDAERLLEESMAIAREIGHRASIARALTGFGALASNQKRFEDSERFHQESHALYKQLGYQTGIAVSLNNLGANAVQWRQFERAQPYYEGALVAAQAADSKQSTAITLSNLGSILRLQKDYPLALENGEKAVAMFREMGDPRWIASSLNMLSLTLIELEDLAAAKKHLLEALAIAVETRGVVDRLESLMGLGEIMAFEGDPQQAVRVLSFATQHPLTKASFRDRGKGVLARLQETLPEPEWEAASEQGSNETLETVTSLWLNSVT